MSSGIEVDSEGAGVDVSTTLRTGYAADMERWDEDVTSLQQRCGLYWIRLVSEIITGYHSSDGTWHEPTRQVEVGNSDLRFTLPVADAQHLRELLIKQRLDEMPRATDYSDA